MDRWWCLKVHEEEKQSNGRIRKILLKVAKAAVKTSIVLMIYLILSGLLSPVSQVIPGFQQMAATFVIVYIVLMIIGDFASGTIFEHFFTGARAVFVIVYFIFTLNRGILEYTVATTNLVIDLRLFLILVMLFGLLGLAKSVLQAIRYASERAELVRV